MLPLLLNIGSSEYKGVHSNAREHIDDVNIGTLGVQVCMMDFKNCPHAQKLLIRAAAGRKCATKCKIYKSFIDLGIYINNENDGRNCDPNGRAA